MLYEAGALAELRDEDEVLRGSETVLDAAPQLKLME